MSPWREAHVVKMDKALERPSTFGKLKCPKSACGCGAKPVSKSKKNWGYGALLDVQMSFRVAGAQDFASCKKWVKRRVLYYQFQTALASVRLLKKICKDGFRVAPAIQETCSWEILRGQGADFLRRVAFWSMGWSGLLRWQHFAWLGITVL